jgi:hypothetical protein
MEEWSLEYHSLEVRALMRVHLRTAQLIQAHMRLASTIVAVIDDERARLHDSFERVPPSTRRRAAPGRAGEEARALAMSGRRGRRPLAK